MKKISQTEIQNLIALHQRGLDDDVISKAASLVKDYPEEIILFNLLGVSFERKGSLKNAAGAYKNALKINPNIPEMNFNLGAILFSENKVEEAIQFYEKSIQLNNNFPEAYFNLGIALQSMGRFDEATECYQKAIQIQPGFFEAVTNIGTIKQLQGHLNEAAEFFKKSLSIREDGRGHYNLANVLRNQGKLSISINHYRKAIELGSGEAEFYSDLGDALWHDGNISEANRFLRMAVEVDSQHPRANYQLAVFLYDNNALEEAINYFKVSKFEDWQERILYCLYKSKQFDLFNEEFANVEHSKHNSPFLATLSGHYAKNFNEENTYKFCPQPLNFVSHQPIPCLLEDNEALRYQLLEDINNADINDRKQSRLYYGTQSAGNLFKRKESSFKALELGLKDAIKKYYELYKNEDCEFIKLFPKQIEFSSSWFVRMQSGGHLTSHIHEDGWISGAIYLSIPKNTKTQDEGAIELSTHGDDYPIVNDDFPKKVIKPKEGDVIFFPSSVFHRTIPFESDEERICIAFDLKPSQELL